MADESCDFGVVRMLRSSGYDVKAIVELMPSASDLQVLREATREGRILLTEDKDFGEWIFAQGQAVSGVVLIRYPAYLRKQMIRSMLEVVTEHGTQLRNVYCVLAPGRARIRSL